MLRLDKRLNERHVGGPSVKVRISTYFAVIASIVLSKVEVSLMELDQLLKIKDLERPTQRI